MNFSEHKKVLAEIRNYERCKQFKNIDELFERVMWYMPVIICVATIIRYLLIKKIDNIVKMYERQEEENNG